MMDFFSWEEEQYYSCTGNVEQFWNSIGIWITKPHCLNKKIGGLDIFEVGLLSVEEIQKCIEYFSESLNSIPSSVYLKHRVKILIDGFFNICTNTSVQVNSCLVLLRILYPKSGHYYPECAELIIKDFVNQTVIFIKPASAGKQKLVTNLPFALSIREKIIILFRNRALTNDDYNNWLNQVLVPKLVWWMDNEQSSSSLISNSLISTNEYLLTYSRLKEKYLNSVLQFWKESTNPEKFISEDIAIASYLLVLWGDKIQNFVDLGCGNGLLVYILTCEGHNGLGIDVRARNIWNDYPHSIVLKEGTISPSLDCVFPEADWLIGNHSDELTPWIPIITARSSYTTNFFLLPCCPYELNGQKYLRNDTSKSTYSDYIDYLENICAECGIDVDRDRLKIPSTKRICLISKQRMYSYHEQHIQDDCIKKLVALKVINCNEGKVKLRDPIEKVKNCTQLNKKYLEEVVLDVANFIIKLSPEGSFWREGEFVHLNELIKLLSPERRKFLKSQCGGLQTLLKNHHYVFLVCNGRVKLRKPSIRILPPKVIKQKKCWFFFNHPDSCPLSGKDCTYQHLS